MNPTHGAAVKELDAATELRTERLAELVHALTGCGIPGALHAVRRSMPDRPSREADALDILARAMVKVRRGIDLCDEPTSDN
jgi:hypothetical protein